jgi:hypothetical protein
MMDLLHENRFLRILWDEKARIIRLDWQEATSAMSDDDFKNALALFAGHVEEKKARGILVDVRYFHHKMSAEVQQWRLANISTRYNAAGVQRFAFLFPQGVQIPPMMNQSGDCERFITRAFGSQEQAFRWLGESWAEERL